MVSARVRPEASHEETGQDRLYAAQEAADFLGIHRSTLHLAVRRLKLTPDAYTPGGHARFRRETLERFSDRLAIDSATGGDGSAARALAAAVAALSHATALEPVCEAVVDAALGACPSFEACAVLSCGEECPRDEFRLVAGRGIQPRLAVEYRWLRRHAGADFISSCAAQQGERFLCGDVQASETPDGSQRVLSGAGWRRCAALPCVSDGQTLGVLVCLGRTACGFSEPELSALEHLADVVTVALRRWRRDEAAQRQLETIGALMRHAQGIHAHAARDDDLVTLRRICQQGSRAKLVREWGVTSRGGDEAPAPLAALMRVAAHADVSQRVEWTDEDGVCVALATPTPGADGAVGGVWRRHDLRSGMELALLQVYAQAYTTLTSHQARLAAE